ncbi:38e33afc-f5ce-45e7-9d1f-886671648e58 [Thermothielavioides terrestris]|uniref:Nuclear pore complex protein Nup85 n=1 Tax=Thermothielavioides terrestris TaxID=2587410 RepID=A0A3S4ANH6_9PEZI|nr:38e33afc-f5ce-45e7-9d1f-886671648e58 [Thermothielavioides terrestris]
MSNRLFNFSTTSDTSTTNPTLPRLPSTPDRHSRTNTGASPNKQPDHDDPFRSSAAATHRSTTPAGPPPSRPPVSSVGSFTPAGAPSASYLGSSIMRGVTASGGGAGGSGGAGGQGKTEDMTPPPVGLFTGIGGGFAGGAGFTGGMGVGVKGKGNLFAAMGGGGGNGRRRNNTPLGRSVLTAQQPRKPSRLSRAVVVDELDHLRRATEDNVRTFGVPVDDDDDDEGGEGAEGEEGNGEEREEVEGDEEGDMWLDMPAERQDPGDDPGDDPGELPDTGDASDLLMLATPAATERVRREAEDIFRASAMQAGGAARRREFRFAAIAKDAYYQLGTAPLTEPPQIILGTENLVARLYDEGVAEAEDEEKMDDTLAVVAGKLTGLWNSYLDQLPRPTEEHAAEIGPGPHATPFEKANYLANLALQIHHTRYEEGGLARAEPLPETLFRWLDEYHDMYGNQVDDILRYRPSPACHSLFWQAVFIALLRGKVGDAARLLRQAGWGHVRRGQRGEYAYVGRALENVQRAAEETIAVLENCPGYEGNWEIWSSDWTLFRVRARGALEHLRRFAEGKEGAFGDSAFSASAGSARGKQSLTGLARRAESQVPWEIYENLNIVFDIVLGQKDAILEAAQDWLEATVGLFGWWDEPKPSEERPFSMAQSRSRSQALVLASAQPAADTESYLDRLARAFHAAVESDFHFNSQNPVEIGMACVFEDNIKAVIGLLRGWSLPVAAAVAEIASLGKWLPPHNPAGIYGLEDLDMDDLEVLGMDPGAPDEVDGIKDSTLVQYAQALADCDGLSAVKDKSGVARDGWELSIGVLGRMDSPERSDEMARDLVQHLVQELRVDSNEMVDRLWTLLNELGMIEYAQDTAETYGDILARDSHRYGEAMWYYALAHRPNKVREVMNLLISYSLIQSTAFPPTADLDEYLRKLLTDRKNTLEQCANQDMEAAELLGKMLSGYASLRQFYEIRDNEQALPHATPQARRQQAAAALVSVIASSDDNIRGGLFDQTRDGIVSEDFLLALLGEALVFVSDPDDPSAVHPTHGQHAAAISLDQIDVMLKAVEDLQAVGSRVYNACDEFLQLVLATAPGGLKGSTPADLLKKSGGAGGGSSSNFVLAGSSRVASQLQKSLSGSGGALGKVPVKRGWDWRTLVTARTKGEDIIRRLRLGLARDLAGLWVAEADAMAW